MRWPVSMKVSPIPLVPSSYPLYITSKFVVYNLKYKIACTACLTRLTEAQTWSKGPGYGQ